jgi:hypothetical protein
MKKLHLDPDQLRIESFATERRPAGEGTVHAHATPPTFCGATCSATCQTNCDCTYTCTYGFPATRCPIGP